jgi:hypothetical protein
MVEFLILFRGQDGRSLKEMPEEYHAHLERLSHWMMQLGEIGHLSAAEPLDAAATVVRQGRKVITDGPFIEAKEMVGGYMRFTANSEDAALEWVKTCPIFEFEDGIVEMRKIELIVS